MLARVRTRALTLPPTDELRQIIEKSRRGADRVDRAGGDDEAAGAQAGLGRPARDAIAATMATIAARETDRRSRPAADGRTADADAAAARSRCSRSEEDDARARHRLR